MYEGLPVGENIETMIFCVSANVTVERKALTTLDPGKFLNSLSVSLLLKWGFP